MSDKDLDNKPEAEEEDIWAAALAEQAEAEQQAPGSGGGDKIGSGTADDGETVTGDAGTGGTKGSAWKDPTPKMEFDDLAAEAVAGRGAEGGAEVNLGVILDVPVTISMEIGRTRIPIRNLLQLNQGSVVELDRLAGEPLDVMVNGTLVAHGEVVVVNEKFGIRLTDVISPAERVRKLK
ncbi:flagellar motor switch protein FliN [Ectothiorhodospira lacustris]|uniref:flagellar motor switch protein FliN n=1 Tax=Ectothiorhodospira lacustris TaxID=2899127 RepID=UPI001EE8FC5B|nr:flagellar motor switch protein FliN [Ectothiorhodospira lacustris]MCG5499522.1 flagellar motor switch protein FliN [Ectothiorhodospira lacustris]MCG5511100.1 flagellar motor switch protein FliN [Ectothiorhodospira lacustris]MCG5522892.1 flagellar motor switch protein FliN [Ectothiorhodospira lacustris]